MLPGKRMRAPDALAAAIVLSSIGSTSLGQFLYIGGLAPCTINRAPSAAAATPVASMASPLNQSKLRWLNLAGRLLGPPMKRANAKGTPGKSKSGLGAHATR